MNIDGINFHTHASASMTYDEFKKENAHHKLSEAQLKHAYDTLVEESKKDKKHEQRTGQLKDARVAAQKIADDRAEEKKKAEAKEARAKNNPQNIPANEAVTLGTTVAPKQ
jgi:hypothetical protein